MWLAGRRHYLGTFLRSEDAARAHDIALLASCPGKETDSRLLNFPAGESERHVALLRGLPQPEIKSYLRKFSRRGFC